MKKTVLTSLAILSHAALAGCDSREKDTLTLEVAYTDLAGKTDGFKMDCKHTKSGCAKHLKVNLPNGEEKLFAGIVNEPTEDNYHEAMAKLQTKTRKEVDDGALVLSEYNQKFFTSSRLVFKDITDKKRWKPGTKRTESFDLALSDGTKVGTVEVKVY